MPSATAITLTCLLVATGQAPQVKPMGRADQSRTKPPIGDRILDDRAFFSAEFAQAVRDTPAGKGRIVSAPCPPIAKVARKYGKPDKVGMEVFKVQDGPTVMLGIHSYGNLDLGVANELVMAVRLQK
jgi:hypothetical protein